MFKLPILDIQPCAGGKCVKISHMLEMWPYCCVVLKSRKIFP